MRAAPRAAEAEADDEATDDEAETAAEEDELLLGCIGAQAAVPSLLLSVRGSCCCPLSWTVDSV